MHEGSLLNKGSLFTFVETIDKKNKNELIKKQEKKLSTESKGWGNSGSKYKMSKN